MIERNSICSSSSSDSICRKESSKKSDSFDSNSGSIESLKSHVTNAPRLTLNKELRSQITTQKKKESLIEKTPLSKDE